MKKFYIIPLLTLVIVGCSPVKQMNQAITVAEKTNPEVIGCQKDLRICPDGTKLARLAPECEFPACPDSTNKTINAQDMKEVADVFQLSFDIPSDWEIEYVSQIESINIYNPSSPEQDIRDKSQIFIRYFKANDFLTLATVNVFDRVNTTIANRPAVIYDIEKKTTTVNFPNQPWWRNQRHFVTDVRETDANPTTFYVIGRRPDLNQAIWDEFLNSLKVNQTKTQNISYTKNRVTKKPFGIYVTPQNSPVSPEKFTGYHTGIDLEYDTTEKIGVTSLADGEIVFSGTVSGYGGVVAAKQNINNQNYIVIYGHLNSDLKTIKQKGELIKKDELIGFLGEAYSSETDGERKHLHLAFYKGSDINLKGYTSSEENLLNWDDPAKIIFN